MGSPRGSTKELLIATLLPDVSKATGVGILKAIVVAVTVEAKTNSKRSATLSFNLLSPPFWFFGQRLTVSVLKYKKLYVLIF